MSRLREVLRAEADLKLFRSGKLKEKEGLIRALDNKWFRLNALYYIKNKDGKKIRFKANGPQRQLYIHGHNRDLILKARQLGFTTFKMIDSLDSCLFTVNFSAGCISHGLKPAKDIYRNKIVFAYENLDSRWLRIFKTIGLNFPTPITDTDMSYVFTNGSSIQVSTSYRGDTLQDLHVSEFGKICRKYPDKAKEIVTGAFEAVGKGSRITIESTAEGREGYFYEYSEKAQKLLEAGKLPTSLDFKFHFFPWYQDPDYFLDEEVTIPSRIKEYFEELEGKTGQQFTEGQVKWYVKKAEVLLDDMMREYPSTPDEAFQQSAKGAYYKVQMSFLRKHGRITEHVPYNPSYPVFTGWDLGMSDQMCIWFAQAIGREVRIIDYFEDSGEGFEYYANVLNKKEYQYSWHFGPHDLSVRELGTGVSRVKSAASYGIQFETVPRIANQMEGINAVRAFLPECWINELNCDRGIDCLDNYKKVWDETLGAYKDRPLHDWASHGAKAFETLARAPIFQKINEQAMNSTNKQSGGWGGFT